MISYIVPCSTVFMMDVNGKSDTLSNEIISLGKKSGADLVGIISVEKLEKDSPRGHTPSVLMSNAKSVIIIACGRKLNEDRDYEWEWGPHYVKSYIKLKDGLGPLRQEARKSVEIVKTFLIDKGYMAVTEYHGWSGVLSFKMVAYLSGLGVFGKGGFIVHPKLGPLNVLSCVVTDASLDYGVPLTCDVCGDCVECIKACKYGSIKRDEDGYKWIAEKCRSYDLIMNPVTLKWTYGPCNSKCVNVCPIGKEELKTQPL